MPPKLKFEGNYNHVFGLILAIILLPTEGCGAFASLYFRSHTI